MRIYPGLTSIPPSLRKLIVVAILCCSFGCLPDYFPRHAITYNVSEDALTGQWRLTNESLRILAKTGELTDQVASIIELRRFGLFVVEFVGKSVISDTGSWTLKHGVIGNTGQVEKNLVELRVGVGRLLNNDLSISEVRKSFVLWRYHGDPDSREFVEYRRQ